MVVDDLTLNEVSCCECGRPIPSIPPWLAGAKVRFQCEECRQKHPRIPGMADIDPRRSMAAADEVAPEAEEQVHEGEEEADEESASEPEEYAE